MDQRPTDIGSRLRQAREQQGVALQDVAKATKISIGALRAIERNDFAQLPGGIFTRSYLRAVAAEVGLSPDEITREYRAQFEISPPEQPPAVREPDLDARVSPLRQLAVLVFSVGLLTYGYWLWTPTEVPPAADDILSTGVELHDTENVALATASSAAASDGPALEVEIRPVGECWVSATADGKLVVYRLMAPGERALVEARESIVLRVGDAAAFAYWINGAPGRQLGDAGVVVTVQITTDNYHALVAGPASTA
jgi:cytoskeletal protein RodZ